MYRFLLFFLVFGAAQAQNCPPVDAKAQKERQVQCDAVGGMWSRFGVYDHLCGIYSCAERTRDAGRECRNRADCEHLCVTDAPPKIGTEVTGHCTAVKTSFGCFTQVDGGRIVGRACMD